MLPMLRRLTSVAALSLLFVVPACESESEPPDGASESFGIGKADTAAGGFTACQLREVLEIVNESTSTAELLKSDVGIHTRAANAIVAHRMGPDGKPGTGDDDIFDDLAELDGVAHVGPAALEAMVKYATPRCMANLDRPYIKPETFAGNTGGGWTRDSFEIEATMTVGGLTGQKLRAILTATDDRDRTIFSRIRKSDAMEAFSFEYPLDEIPWSSSAHDIRQDKPFMSWSIERGNFDISDDNKREISLGTDKMDDTYYDTRNFDLLETGMVLRGRIRWDTDTAVRRLLIAAKLDSEVDAEGLKRAAKIDVRTEGGTHKDSLDRDVMSGTVPWSGGATPIEPIQVVYKTLAEAGALDTINDEADLLLLDPKVRIRSLRSRYHLNFTTMSAMNKVYTNARDRVQVVIDYAQARLDASAVESGDVAEVEALIAQGKALLDNSALLEARRAELSAIDQALTDIVYPESFSTSAPSDWNGLEKRRLIAEAATEAFNAFADAVDDVDRVLTNTRNVPGEDAADMFVEWQQIIDTGLTKYRVATPFLNVYMSMSGDPALKAQMIEAYNTFGAEQLAADNDDFEDFEPIDEATWDGIQFHLEFERLKYSRRMIEAGGTIAHAIWFDLAREYYVPESFRTSSNFIIDTMDFTEMLTNEEWNTIPADKRTPGDALPADKVFHSVLVNEVQLELTEVAHYIDRIEELKTAAEAAPGDAELARNLAGARFIFDELQDSIKVVANLKGDDIVDRLEDEGAPNGITWEPATHSKGKTALLIMTDKL